MAVAISQSLVEEEEQQGHTSEAAGSSTLHASAADNHSQVEVTSQEGSAADELWCSICLEVLVGASCDRPEGAQPSGGWGYVGCCAATFHFECVGHWLKMSGNDQMVESMRGPVELDLGCPHCRAPVSKSSRRMLQSEG